MKLSFVIPAYNSATWLSQAIESCLKQTKKDIEVVVIDDFSSDSTEDYMAWQVKQDERVVYHRNVSNKGRSFARNLGNLMASGEVICVLDADDLAFPNRAKVTEDRFKSGATFVYGSAVQIDACGRNLGEIRADVFNKDKAIERMENRVVHSSVAYTKDFAMKYPYKDGDIAALGIDDWAQQIDAALAGVKLDYNPQLISAYRILNSGISKTRDESKVREFKKGYLRAVVGDSVNVPVAPVLVAK